VQEDMCKPTIGNESLHEISNHKICYIKKSDCQEYNVPRRNIYKYNSSSPDRKTQSQITSCQIEDDIEM
jgi:hypothetical protein